MNRYPVGTPVKITRGSKRGTYTVAGWDNLTSRYILRSTRHLPVWADPQTVKKV